MFFLFFFFQAEDGIRDGRVTGVQTCALPISRHFFPVSQIPKSRPIRRPPQPRRNDECIGEKASEGTVHNSKRLVASLWHPHRSEERRVGKECRSRWSPHHEKKKEKNQYRE